MSESAPLSTVLSQAKLFLREVYETGDKVIDYYELLLRTGAKQNHNVIECLQAQGYLGPREKRIVVEIKELPESEGGRTTFEPKEVDGYELLPKLLDVDLPTGTRYSQEGEGWPPREPTPRHDPALASRRYTPSPSPLNARSDEPGKPPDDDPNPVNASGNASPEVVGTSPSGRVVLYGRADKPSVDGKERDKLTAPQYDVVCALLKTGENGLTKDQLEGKETGRGGGRGILKRLAKKAGWKAVIGFAETTGSRYRTL